APPPTINLVFIDWFPTSRNLSRRWTAVNRPSLVSDRWDRWRAFQRQSQTDDARLAGLRSDDLEFAVVPLQDFVADHQPQPQAHVAGGVKRFRHFFSGVWSEAGAVVLKLDWDPSGTLAVWFRLQS